MWRSRVSIPVPADCEPTALPSELHPLMTANKKCVLQPMGFEPMPLSRLAPKASALTTRPKLQLLRNSGNQQTKNSKITKQKNSPRGDSNPQPPDPKSDALSIAPLGRPLSKSVHTTAQKGTTWQAGCSGTSTWRDPLQIGESLPLLSDTTISTVIHRFSSEHRS